MTSEKILPQCDVLFYITPSQGLISQEFIPVHDLNVPQRGVQITEKALKILKIKYKSDSKDQIDPTVKLERAEEKKRDFFCM